MWWVWLLPVWLALAACSRDGTPSQAQPRPPAVPVAVAAAASREVPLQLTAVGNVLPAESVSVRAQVGGQLATVRFREGEDVRAGQVLFTIDPRPFEAQLAQAQANYARNRALAQNARREAERYATLVEQGFVARSQYEQLAASAAATEATARADLAAVEQARLQLGYTTIRAPIDGRTGRVLVHRGNVVRANETDLVVINRIRPIDVVFALPATDLPAVQQRVPQGPIEVTVTTTGSAPPPGPGRLTFVDNRVDPQTATVQLKASFPNDDARLWPGLFVTVVVTLGVEPHAIVVPARAVETGQQGTYVFVVQPDQTVESRPVAVSRQVGEEAVIARGLTPGETVVTEGQLRLAPGMRVEVAPPARDTTPRSPS